MTAVYILQLPSPSCRARALQRRKLNYASPLLCVELHRSSYIMPFTYTSFTPNNPTTWRRPFSAHLNDATAPHVFWTHHSQSRGLAGRSWKYSAAQGHPPPEKSGRATPHFLRPLPSVKIVAFELNAIISALIAILKMYAITSHAVPILH